MKLYIYLCVAFFTSSLWAMQPSDTEQWSSAKLGRRQQRTQNHVASYMAYNQLGHNALHSALLYGKHNDVLYYINCRGMDLDCCTQHEDESPLFLAAERGRLQIVKELIKRNVDVNKSRKDGVTPLFIAAVNDDCGIVTVLLKAGADVNKATLDGETPLFPAAAWGYCDIVQRLLAAKAHADHTRKDGATALHLAASSDEQESESREYLYLRESVRLLLAFRANPTIKADGFAPYEYAQQGTRIYRMLKLAYYSNLSA